MKTLVLLETLLLVTAFADCYILKQHFGESDYQDWNGWRSRHLAPFGSQQKESDVALKPQDKRQHWSVKLSPGGKRSGFTDVVQTQHERNPGVEILEERMKTKEEARDQDQYPMMLQILQKILDETKNYGELQTDPEDFSRFSYDNQPQKSSHY
ncbi:uncharacterized protein LOC143469390 [Clavelina lepadiformis]|uniref:Uncharacterized protein n=1 Tax=Clavelina lepadiformis TaxID=159417 RepID=A0ABP0F4B5_CLALP